ncbi:MAG: energy transducer TonB [bacterium]
MHKGVNEVDRFSVTLVFIIILHAMIILGISFSAPDAQQNPTLPELDVILIQKKTEQAPDKADYLAQANQEGGGNTDQKKRPSNILASPIPQLKTGIAPLPSKNTTPKAQPDKQTRIVTVESSKFKVTTKAPKLKKPDLAELNSSTILQRSAEVAKLEAEIDKKIEAYAKRPRKKFISANTREYVFASYMQAWVNKVERIGNLNYPDEARRKNMKGALVMTVAIDVDGKITDIQIITSSGFKILDDAATRIVELSAPFAALPPNIREKVDELHITRTWRFTSKNRLTHD